MKKKNPKIKYSILSNSYEDGGMKSVDLSAKIINLQCSWIKRLFDENFHESKIIPAYLIKTNFCKNFKFCHCYEPSIRSLKNVPTYHKIKPTIYKEMTKNWAKYLSYFSYYRPFFPSFYGLTRKLKLTKRAFLFLALREKTSILSLKFFMAMAK